VNPDGTPKQGWNGLIEFNPGATQAERDAALALNIHCFHHIGWLQTYRGPAPDDVAA